jgi:hypothetical protein
MTGICTSVLKQRSVTGVWVDDQLRIGPDSISCCLPMFARIPALTPMRSRQDRCARIKDAGKQIATCADFVGVELA